jgi:hypothetical protein
MRPLLTWSGDASHDIATFFRDWLPAVLPDIQPWVSSEDIAKGKRWFEELSKQLDESPVSIVFITPENARSSWLYYEVGVMAAKLEESLVCPYLLGVETQHVKDTPLGQFQWTLADEDDTWKLVRSINSHPGSGQHDESLIEASFRKQWPKLKRKIDRALENVPPLSQPITQVDPSIEEQLTSEARQLLLEAALDHQGRILSAGGSEGQCVLTNGKNMVTEGSPRSEAIWTAALNELVEYGLVKDVGYKGEIFKMTRKGFEIADLIKGRGV